MKIKIVKKEIPFSRMPVVFTTLPKTTFGVKVFHGKLEFLNLENNANEICLEIFFDFSGPINNFHVSLNAIKGLIQVLGFSKEGFFRYELFLKEDKICLFFDKAPNVTICMKTDGGEKEILLQNKLNIILPLSVKEKGKDLLERLSLGEHKAQDVDLIERRGDLKEILPIWFAIGQTVPALLKPLELEGVLSLFQKADEQIKKKEKIDLKDSLLNVYRTGFKSLFFPLLLDERHQGILKRNAAVSGATSPLLVLSMGHLAIRSMFFQREKNTLSILPCLLPSLHSGRIINLFSDPLTIDMEWSKKILKKMIIRTRESTKINLQLQQGIKSFRLRTKLNEKGVYLNPVDFIEIEPNVNYLLDCFCK